ncbi:alternate-type signal peptide domain-containing protein [Microbacterium sp. SORGH_AS_0888]|uniref:alternate-type signal peptide domain-containing protein n=1 Tax=Microbacterium sp. SORGH_AS_0888 TaxID=3041791 RepID=UPI00278A43FB|nr:alternate-type signal peptide domain-containing protein [Microbacterium sp. SORGH_AS_0888]MDQ1130276.1 alternate signal-mediated exported protein [Microbacterium sp. SORGH_AS_0888]
MSAASLDAAGSRRERRSRRPLTRRGIAWIAALQVSALLVGAGAGTYALWSASAVFSGGPISTGDLDIVRGAGTWRQVTEGVAAPASGQLADGPGGFASMPGDVVEVVVPVQTTLRGENLRAQLTVAAGVALSSELASGAVTATYRVESTAATTPAPPETPLGTPADVAGLEGADGGAVASWNVVVTVHIGGDYLWRDVPQAGPASWSLDDFTISLAQVRPAVDPGQGGQP